MDWMYYARTDFRIYQDVERIKQYVIKEKITPEQYYEVTGEAY